MQNRKYSEQSAMAMGLVTTFIFDPSDENYFQLSFHEKILKENSPAILRLLSSPMFSESVASEVQHSKAYILMALIKDANREQNANEAIELLSKLLQSDPNNSLLWNTLSLTLSKLDSLTQHMQEKLFALTNQHKQTPMQFQAFCSGQSIVHNGKNASAWKNLGVAFYKGASLADLPPECLERHFKGKENFSPAQLQAFCWGQSIVHNGKNANAWGNLGMSFHQGASLADLPPECRDSHFQGKENFFHVQLQAFCWGKSILCDEKNAPAWHNLGVAFDRGVSLADLPPECLDSHFQGKDHLTPPQLATFCAGQAIVCDEKFSLSWSSLGVSFAKSARLADLPQACRDSHFQGKENFSPAQLQAFCCGKSILCDEKYAPAWSNLGLAFQKGASLADLPPECLEQLFKGKENFSTAQLRAFCCGKSILCDEKFSLAWNSLGISFDKGTRLSDLPPECLERHFKGKENFSPAQLRAFCCGKSILCDEKFSLAWNNLGVAFDKGARLADLPPECLERHFKGKENLSGIKLQAFCYGQAIVCDEKEAPAWHNLGVYFDKGARLADLPPACHEQYFKGKENFSPAQLRAFCAGKADALKKPANHSDSIPTSTAEINSSTASSQKRASNEVLENPIKKQKITHSNSSSIPRPTIPHPSSTFSTSSIASSASMTQTPHSGTQFTNQAFFPIYSVNGYPLSPNHVHPALQHHIPQAFAMPPSPNFFPRINPPTHTQNAPTQNPQPEVQITGTGAIPALNNLAHQVTLLPSLAKIKEEPAETQTHGNHFPSLAKIKEEPAETQTHGNHFPSLAKIKKEPAETQPNANHSKKM